MRAHAARQATNVAEDLAALAAIEEYEEEERKGRRVKRKSSRGGMAGSSEDEARCEPLRAAATAHLLQVLTHAQSVLRHALTCCTLC